MLTKKNDIRYGANCSLCSNKLDFVEKAYVHILSDGTLCSKCNRMIHQLLDERRWWADTDEFNQLGLQGEYDFFAGNSMPLKEARALLTLRDKVAEGFAGSVGLDGGSVFAIQRVVAVCQKPSCFILRAMKVKNKAVLKGFALKGKVKKGDRIHVSIGGTDRSFQALDVIPTEVKPFNQETFYDQLSANVHKHSLSEGEEGWIILDTEDCQSLNGCAFAATGV